MNRGYFCSPKFCPLFGEVHYSEGKNEKQIGSLFQEIRPLLVGICYWEVSVKGG